VQSLNIDAATAKALQIGEIEGAVVISPVVNGPAEKAGIRRGDLIISVNGLRVRNVGELTERLRGAGRGGAIQVGLFRMGKPLELTVTAGTPPTLEEFMNLLPPEAGRAEAFALRGLAERAKGNVDEGERLAEQALQSLKTFDLAILAAGLSKLDRDHPEAARKVLESMRTEAMSVAVLHGQVAQAAAWLKEGNVEKAREAYLRVDIPVKPEWKPLWDDRQAFLKAMRPRVLECIKNAVDFEKKGRLREALDAVAWASLFAADEKEAGEMRNALFCPGPGR
jgi:tetratricopeptide (TPR) repeat protein